MKKNRIFSPFALLMIAGIVLCVAADAIFFHEGSFSAMGYVTMAAAILGIFNVVLSSEGNIWNYIFGLATVATYGVVAFNAGNYGDGLMNLAFLVPMNVLGFFMWKKRGASLSSDSSQSQVEGRRMSWKVRSLVLTGVAISIVILAQVLGHYGATAPWVDAAKTVLNITAQILMTFAFMEQWAIWIVVNAASVALWVISAMQGKPGAELMIVMWVFYFIISIHGFRVWQKLSK